MGGITHQHFFALNVLLRVRCRTRGDTTWFDVVDAHHGLAAPFKGWWQHDSHVDKVVLGDHGLGVLFRVQAALAQTRGAVASLAARGTGPHRVLGRVHEFDRVPVP